VANIVTLEQAKAWLQIPNPSQANAQWDTIIQFLINAADCVLEFECDDVVPKLRSEHYDGGDYTIFLKHIPIVSVQNVEEGWGYVNYELDYCEVNSPPETTSMFGYSIDSYPNGEISRRSAGNVQIPFRAGQANIFVQYTSGLETIPGNIVLAEFQLVRHWFQNEELRATTLGGTNISYDATMGQVYTRDTESGTQNINLGVPEAILENLKASRHMPYFA
jgi:hypothetical protein